MEGKPDELSSVGVAVRVRPLNKTEKEMNSPVCMIVDSKERKIITSKDKSFTFDQVFDMSAKQVEIFESSTKDLVLSLFAGYNATVLAYGQTGSGKTYTMGSAQVSDIKEEEIGIIPRVISMLFQEIEKRKNSTEFLVKASFLEIYNEEIKDLLDPKSTTDKSITIKEIKGNIVCLGLHEEKVMNYEELLSCLEKGTVRRIVQKTKMNEFSSRSHAIFSIVVEQTSIDPQPEVTEGQEYIMAKFHFVDLAGSERVKRTEAEGDVLRQGISINLGLLSLGKVISALTDDSQKKAHVPYRDSKLTRILQDSLGGNARTYMIACISPAEVNEEETLSTLRYASRARNIKNKPVVNRDPQSALIASLRDEVSHLKLEIKAYQKVLNSPGSGDLKASLEALKRTFGSEAEDEELKATSLKLQNTEWKLTQVSSELEVQKQTSINLQLELLQVQKERDLMKIKNESYSNLLKQHNIDFAEEDDNCAKLVEEYQVTIQSLRKVDEQKDRLIFELQGLKTNLEKELGRESKLLQKKSEELERLRRSRDDPGLEEEILRNVEDYGRTFAETILAKISKPVAEETQEEAEVDEAETEMKEQQEELATVERKIKEHEDIKKNIEEAFRDLQPQFLEEMSHQYYKKIEELKHEKTNLEKERDLALEKMKGSSVSEKNEVSERFKAKIQALEERLKENKRKDKELGEMQKLVETQKKQLFKLDDEIRKAKTEKIRLQKKIKEENEEVKKWKTDKQKELLKMKRNGMIKDKEIASLRSENRKKELIARKKTEEVAALQKRQKDVQLIKKKSLTFHLEVLKQWVEEYTVACVDEREITQALNDEIHEKENIEKEIQEITSYKAKLEVALDRHELMMAEDEPSIDKNELYTKIIALKEEISEIQDRAEILDNKIPRKNNLILGYSSALSNSKVEEIRSKALTLTSVEDSQVLVSILFDEILAKALQAKQSEKTIREHLLEIENKQEMIDQAYKETEVVIKNYEKEIGLMKEEFQAQRLALQEEIFMLKGQEDDPGLKKPLNELVDRSESLKSKAEEPKSRHAIVPLSKARESLKKRRMEDEKNRKTTNSGKTSTRVDDESVRSTPSKHRTYSESDSTKFLQKWKLTGNVDTGKGIIYSMLAQENILYTALTGLIKIWNLDTLSKISEFSTQNNTAKALAFCPENNFCIGGCGNTVKVWETVSLHSIGQLQVEMEEVRGLKFQNNLLYCCGKSSEHCPALCIWDLRQCQTPVFQSELGQEISSMTVSQDSIFYSRKSNHICRNFTNNEELLIYPSPHLASVTGLAVYGDTLVSSSRDKTLKQFDSAGNCISSLTGFHTDWINCLEVDYQQRQVYSGGKDGKIKVWKGSDGEAAKLAGDLPSFNFSVLSISSLQSQEVGIVSAGNDKTFKIWKMTEDCDF